MIAIAGAGARARALLWTMRQTPLRRGALSKPARQIRGDIARTLVAEGVPASLARRLAFQLVVKIDLHDLRDDRVWRALGVMVCDEVEILKARGDRRIARTVLDAAIDAADPISTGRRYLAEYRLVAKQVHAIEPNIARTLANATFTAGMPLGKAMEHLQKFLTSIAKQKDHPDVARLLARAGFRAE